MEKLLTQSRAELPVASMDLSLTTRRFKKLMQQLQGVNELKTDRVKIPAGGGVFFELPGETPDKPDAANEIVGVILKYSYTNAYWRIPYGSTGESERPYCVSNDGISGFDVDGMETPCRICPRNKFGSADDSRGKACKNMVQLFVLREGDPLPIEILLPAMSVANFTSYIIRQVSTRDLDVWQVLTKITLTKQTNSGGQPYAQAQFQAIGQIESDPLREIRRVVTPLLGYARMDDTALEDGSYEETDHHEEDAN